ncbi:synaptic vesicle glycoprotein 2B-like [Sitodiplosis mosellana]|uniref:synaptic vesicle glycoprotein 2B-like n=1 Tax=Sitodiplosis mosellana TaxID=263140 RepID=UPI002443A0AD|nr:synaptic vesicle glycoprotein 2B-like [Sitodiplosis mosellana]
MCRTENLFDAENARRDSDVHPQINHSTPKKKAVEMDEAISKTKFGVFNYFVICVTGLVLYTVIAETCAICYVLPILDCDMTDVTTAQKGVLAGVAFVGVICSSHLWGFLADTKGRRCVIQPTLFVTFLLSVTSSFIQNFYLFVALRFLSGFFVSASSGNMFAYLGEFHNNKQRSRAIMSATVIYSALCVIQPIAAWAVINQEWQFEVPFIGLTYKPWRLFIIVYALPGLFSALALLFLPESPKFVLGQGHKVAAYQILQKMNRWNNGKKEPLEEFEIHEESETVANRQRILAKKDSRFPLLKTVWHQTAPLFKAPYLKSMVLICTIQFGIVLTCQGFAMFFAEIINKMSDNLDSFYDQRMMMCDILGRKSVNISVMNEINDEICVDKLDLSTLGIGLAIEVIFALSSALAGLLINKVGNFAIIFFVLLTCGLSGIGCMLTDIPALQVALYLYFVSCGVATNVLSSATVELYPTTLRAMAMSISLMFARLGGVTGANAAALLLDDYCEISFYLPGSILIAMGLLAFFIPNIHKKKHSDEEHTKVDARLSILSFRGSVKNF